MKTLVLTILIVLFLWDSAIAGNTPQKNPYVNCSVSVKQKKLKSGAKGELLITLTPRQGIHINLEPPLSVTLDQSKAIASLGNIAIAQKDTILDVSKPIRFTFTLAQSIKPGKVTIGGAVTYFYCSETEGWCSKFKQQFEAKFTLIK